MSDTIDSIIKSTSNRFNVPKIDRIQGEILLKIYKNYKNQIQMLIKLLLEQSLAVNIFLVALNINQILEKLTKNLS